MSDLGSIDSIGAATKVKRAQSMPQASIEATRLPSPVQTTSSASELHTLEIEKAEADRAFALMMEISQKLEKAYNELNPERVTQE